MPAHRGHTVMPGVVPELPPEAVHEKYFANNKLLSLGARSGDVREFKKTSEIDEGLELGGLQEQFFKGSFIVVPVELEEFGAGHQAVDAVPHVLRGGAAPRYLVFRRNNAVAPGEAAERVKVVEVPDLDDDAGAELFYYGERKI